MNKGIILTGGCLDRSFVMDYLQKVLPGSPITRASAVSELIAADRAVLFCQEAGIVPGHIVGDFDSAGKACLSLYEGRQDVEIRAFRPEKDWTDTELALDVALELGWDDITVLGATGTRIDHVFGSLQMLALASSKGVACTIVDPWNRIYIKNGSFSIARDGQWGRYVSFFAFNGPVENLSLRGVKYPLTDFRLDNIGTLTVSNEIVEDKAEITFPSGSLLVIEARD